ncbi:hypothetical protein G7Y79_00051g086520 [Physcia stellaris]|nr:hypothetical protein G7Y79_00051g086520 [Physcia stellaris]
MTHFLPARPLLFIFFSSAIAAPKSIWRVSILEAPAPPADLDTASPHALRNRKYLPAEIASIIGAYLFFLLCIGTALLLVGRRLRRAAQASPRTLAMEMMKPVRGDVPKAFDPSPMTPLNKHPFEKSPSSTINTQDMWPSPQKSSIGYGFGRKGHNKQASIQSSVVTFDESVIEDDKDRNQREMERLYAAVMEHEEQKSTTTLNKTRQQAQHPPELQHLRSSSAVEPPISPLRTDAKSPGLGPASSPRKHTRPSPITTGSRASSRSSFGSFGKKRGLRTLPISPPMGSPDLVPDYSSTYGEAEPLSPRHYEPGPPPPTPPQQEAFARQAERLSPRHSAFPRTAMPTIQSSGGSRRESSETVTSKNKRAPAPLAIQTGAPASASPSQTALRTAPLPFRSLRSPRTAAERPPSTIKATVLESKPHNQHLAGPRTGVPMTPYSPYMPFTPLTPMTPSRLVTREERKKKEKEDGRRVATAVDKVEEESEIWGDAYP